MTMHRHARFSLRRFRRQTCHADIDIEFYGCIDNKYHVSGYHFPFAPPTIYGLEARWHYADI